MKKGSAVERWLVIPDVHCPYHDRSAWNCVKKAIGIVKPDGFVCLGDFAEAESVSPWKEKRRRQPRDLDDHLQFYIDPEVKELNHWLDDLDGALDKAGVKKKVYIQGNHDEWFDKFAEDNPHLSSTKHQFGVGYKFKDLLNFSGRGYTFVQAGKMYSHGKLWFYHGHHCKSGTNHARWHLLNKQVNVMYGHWHDVQEATVGTPRGRKGAWSIGCLKSMRYDDANQFTRYQDLNWQHAFSIVDFWGSGQFTVDTVRIIDGRCSLWGQLLNGNVRAK